MPIRCRPWLFICLALLADAQSPPTPPAAGVGNLLVAPTRVVFEGRKRGGVVNLSNLGGGKATFRISLVRMEMDEQGGFREVPTQRVPGQVAPEDLIRFSPREVTLEAQESQTIRLQIRKPPELPTGEYRIHMLFRAVPPAPEPRADGDQPGSSKAISIQLTPVFGISIPLIVRHGETSAKLSISDLILDPEAGQVRFTLNRSGNQSSFGDVKISFVPQRGSEETLAQANKLAIYCPNAFRKMSLPIPSRKSGSNLSGGRIRVTYSVPSSEGGALLAEASLNLP